MSFNPFLKFFLSTPSGYLHEGEALPGGAPNATSDSTPAAATPAAPAAAAPATPQAATPAPATSATPDDRSNWVPSYRLREAREAAVREAQTQYQSREAEIRAEAERYRQQVLALTGVTPPQQNTEANAVKEQFYALFPKLRQLEERGDDVLGILERAGDMEAQSDHYWQSYGKQTVDKLFSGVEAALGHPLNDEGKRSLHAAFIGFVQSSPELTARYSTDPTLVNEYVQAFTSQFIDPARRAASVAVAGRANTNLPQDTPGGAPRVAGAPKPANLDERVAAGWAIYNQGKTGGV